MEKTFLLSHGSLTIPCKLVEPDFGEIRRVVLGVHGLGGSAKDAIQTGIAEEMEMFYAASLRFDFPCHGESTCEELTLANCVDSLLAVAQYARERYADVEDLCIFASGFGAYITLIALQELLEMPGKVKLVVQTPSVRMHETLLAMRGISQPTFQAMDQVTFQTPRPFEVTYHFYEELRDNFALTSYPIPMLILHGEEDDYIRMEDIQHFRRINDRAKLVIIPGTSHRFLEDGAWDMVLDLTRDWFEFEQVLCCDWE
ncbi:MAG: alpha/beta fold hydrolase [Oscillospiraceae bacterium]|nr:alpha/beta fold hydrolase [Oscillospiraceae bacterium]